MGVSLERAWQVCAMLDEVDEPLWDYELDRAVFLTDPRQRPTNTRARFAQA